MEDLPFISLGRGGAESSDDLFPLRVSRGAIDFLRFFGGGTFSSAAEEFLILRVVTPRDFRDFAPSLRKSGRVKDLGPTVCLRIIVCFDRFILKQDVCDGVCRYKPLLALDIQNVCMYPGMER